MKLPRQSGIKVGSRGLTPNILKKTAGSRGQSTKNKKKEQFTTPDRGVRRAGSRGGGEKIREIGHCGESGPLKIDTANKRKYPAEWTRPTKENQRNGQGRKLARINIGKKTAP